MGVDDNDLKARLLKHRIPEGEVELELGTVRVRGLSRGEVFATQQTRDIATAERRIIAVGLVDPVMTEAEVALWQRNSPAGEIEAVVGKIQELSGLGKGADKSGLPDVRDDAGDGVRVLPGAEAEPDGGPAAGADEQ